jgi:MFS family permease
MTLRRGWIFLFLFTLQTINYADRVSLSVAAKSISVEMHLSPVQMGYLLSSFLWTYIVCLIPVGILVDRFGSRIMNAFGIALWSSATILTGKTWNITTLIMARFTMGAAESTTHPSGARVVREWIPAGERGFTNSVFLAGSQAGPALGALVVGTVGQAYGWRASFYVLGAFGFVWLAAWLVWFDRPERVRWLGAQERDKILRERNASIASLNEKTSASHVLRLLRTKTMWGLALTMSSSVYLQYLFLTWLPSYLQATRHLTILRTGLFTALPYMMAAVLIIVVGFVIDRILGGRRLDTGRRRLIVVGSLLCSAIILLTPFTGNIYLLLALITISMTAQGLSTSFNLALLNDMLVNPQDIGKAVSLLLIGGNSFGLMAPVVTGYVIALTGSYNGAFVIGGTLLILGAMISFTMTRKPIDTMHDRASAIPLGLGSKD